jgi:hypothetical protein
MENVTEVARVVKHWLTLKSDITEDEGHLYVNLDDEPDIESAKQAVGDIEIESVRQKFANLLFSGAWDWLYKDNQQLEVTLPQWFLPGSNNEFYLEQYATGRRTEVGQALYFLGTRMDMWARGEGRPQQNPQYEEETWPAGTQYYMYDGEQWLYSPVPSGEGTNWQTMDFWTEAAAQEQADAQPAVDLSTMEKAQEAAVDVAAAAEHILENLVKRNPRSIEGIDPARIKVLVLEALKVGT